MKLTRLWSVLILFTVLISLTAPAVFAAGVQPADVPPSHWAYKEVKLMLDKGYLQVYQDLTFQGDKPVDRYTLATVVAKILVEAAAGQMGGSKEDISLLRSLTNEFRTELVETIARDADQDKQINDLLKQAVVMQNDLTMTRSDQLELQQTAQQLLADLVALKKETEILKEDLTAAKQRVTTLENENLKLKAELEQMRKETASTNRLHFWLIVAAAVVGLVGIFTPAGA